MKSFLEDLKDKKRTFFKTNYHEMLASFNLENETIAGYNGRQLLELIQNCDDEGSDIVFLELDKEKKLISISNNGTPFSEQGYRSLSISYLSSKTSKRKFIGNKGLGFRSIINWSNQIKIISNKIALTYSHKILTDEYNTLFSLEEQSEILKEYNYAKNILPVPFLALPKIEDYNLPVNYTTTIEIQYKDKFFDDILKQIENINPETLLFLKNINEIIFKGFDDVINLKREKTPLNSENNEFAPSDKITINNNTWFIFKDENIIKGIEGSTRDEEEFYQLKLALKEDLNDNKNLLYSYFQTDIHVDLPYIIHGTFDLDQTRNRLNNTPKNIFVLKKLVDLIINTAKYLSVENVSWKPLRLLSYTNKNPNLDKLGFYDIIDEAIYNEKLFPCIDNTYRSKNEVIYLNDAFSRVIIENNSNGHFANMLIPSNGFDLYKYEFRKYIQDIGEKIDDLSENIDNIKKRADFIRVVNENFPQTKFNIIIDRKEKLINKDMDIFTPTKKEISIPEYCDIKIINTELYHRLLDKFNLKNSKEKARDLQRKLKNNTKIHSFEPTPLALKIISNTSSAIKEEPNKTETFIKQMVQSLFSNYKLSNDNSSLPSNYNVPLFSKSGKLSFSNNLHLSEFYPTGKITVDLFSEIYTDDDFLVSPSYFEFGENEDLHLIEQFFLWLNVNKFVKYHIKEDPVHYSSDYFEYVESIKGYFQRTRIELIQYKAIENFNLILDKIPFEKLIVWLHIDEEIKNQLNDANNSDKIEYFYRTNHAIYSKPSYIKFKLFGKGYNLKNHLLEENLEWLNDKKINYTNELFIKHDITKRDIDNILVLLGAKDSFNELSIKRVTEIIEILPKKFPEGKNSQKIYRKALQHYKTNGKELSSKVELFADNGERLNLYPQDEIYFSDKVKIPEKLKIKYPILNFPPRSGGKEAIDFFRINDLKNLKIDISNHSINEFITDKFGEFFERIKPLLLVYRINKIDNDVQKQKEAALITKLEIKLCYFIEYTVDDMTNSIDNNEFINLDTNTFLIKVNKNSSVFLIRKNSIFSDSFASIISQTFDVVSDKNEFRNILRDDFNDAEHSIKKNFGEELLIESKELLGMSDSTISFWKAVFSTLGKNFYFDVNERSWIEDVRNELKLDINLDDFNYENINKKDNQVLLQNIFERLNLDIIDFNKNALNKINLEKNHLEVLKDYFFKQTEIIKSSIWIYLNSKTIKEQEKFIDLIHLYENNNDFIEEEASSSKYNFNIDKEEILNDFLVHSFREKFDINEDNIIDPIVLLQENEKEFTQEELDFLTQIKEFRSLKYFKNNIEYLKRKYNESIVVHKTVTKEPEIIDHTKYEVVQLDDNFTVNAQTTRFHSTREPFVPGASNDTQKKQKGDKSEDVVYKKLVFLYESKNVSWKSKDDEGLHYDIRYSPDNGEHWKFVEVKTFSNNSFILTRSEKEFGEKNNTNYEIWLVNNDHKIFTISNFFNNENFVLTPKDYLVSLEIDHHLYN